MRTKTTLALAFTLACAATPAPALAAASVIIVNNDAAGEGFNDPTPVAPVGGNTGTTLGQQRLIAFQHAAGIRGAQLDSAVPIRIRANFDPLTCTATTGTLGSAGALYVVRDFPNAPLVNTWYPGALADKLAGVETNPGDDIAARFNSNVGTPGCLAATPWYLGLDGDHRGTTDLVTVLLHEFAHGLGFASFISSTTGEYFSGFPDAYMSMAFDTTTGKNYVDMTPPERLTSMQNGRRVVWQGPFVTAAADSFLAPGVPRLTTSPAVVPSEILLGTATFGPALGGTPLVAQVVLAPDAVGSPTDACSPLINLATGKIVLVDRGTCPFVDKALNVQNAGGVGMIVADNTANNPPNGMAGLDTGVTIPSVQITQAVGTQLKAALALGPVTATLVLDASLLAGADEASGRPFLYTPSPVVQSSNFSHWDTAATPNLLMEAFINSDLGHDVDLTMSLLADLGWNCVADQDCDDGVACTADACTDGVCQNDALADGTPCPDADACNGAETCISGICSSGAPLACDDGHVCTAESCDPATGCASTPVSAGTACGGGGTCNGAGACTGSKCLGVHLASSTPLLPSGGAAGLIATGVSCGGDQAAEYQFLYQREGGPAGFTVFRPFGTDPGTAFLNAGLPSGKYTIEVRARTVGTIKSYESKARVTLLSGNVCTSVTLQAPGAPQMPGTTVNLTAVATCTEGEAEYEFSFKPAGGASTVFRPWGAGTAAWDTTGASMGSYSLLVKARGAGNTTKSESARTASYTLADRCAQVTGSISPQGPLPTGALLEIAGGATCQAGSTPELRYRLRPHGVGAFTDIAPWGAGPTVSWDTTGLAPGVYDVRIETRSPGMSAAQASRLLTYTLTP